MNKIYSLKYSHITGGLVAVSELTRKVSVGTSRKKVILGIILSSIYGSYGETAFAAMLDINNIWTRDYLDLAQNRGEFRPGATNVQLMMKDGKIFHFPELPVPDFSAVSNKGATTSIGGAYSVTATHNGTQHHAITTQSWDQTAYKASNRVSSGDFSVHRLNKFVVETTGVTESADFSLSPEDAMKRYGVNYNGKEQIIGFRAGAGTTSTILNGKQYLFGQNYNPDLLSASLFNLDWKNKSYIYTNRTPFKNSPIFGDSGSGSYLYDKEQQKWVFHGVTSTVGFISSTNIAWTNYSLFNNILVNNLKKNFTNTMQLDGKKQELSSIIKDKDLSVSGGGVLTLKQDTDLGIGGLIFDKNQTYKVYGKDKSYKGAGIDIDNNTTVEWNVKGVAGDNLHKIGSGTLDVKIAQGNNLKIGNGTVILSAEKAFNKIYMAGGKGTVKINAKDALSESG
ncbi:serine protease autotransporter toxin SigA, partial [Shigella flexneri]|nr:serine protease autotransporter toxin SigA [Shigella flexneri]EGW1731749.1 serine protease autotransporter toxin SigA [Shigella flexneri]